MSCWTQNEFESESVRLAKIRGEKSDTVNQVFWTLTTLKSETKFQTFFLSRQKVKNDFFQLKMTSAEREGGRGKREEERRSGNEWQHPITNQEHK